MNRRLMLILAACSWLAVIGADCARGQSVGGGPDLLEKRSWELAGRDAVDCGSVPLRADPKAATDCALAANKAGKPFRVLYHMQGIDSLVAVAFVRSPDGTLQGLIWDSDPSGGGGRGPGIVSVMGCPMPVQLYPTREGQLACVPPRPLVPR